MDIRLNVKSWYSIENKFHIHYAWNQLSYFQKLQIWVTNWDHRNVNSLTNVSHAAKKDEGCVKLRNASQSFSVWSLSYQLTVIVNKSKYDLATYLWLQWLTMFCRLLSLPENRIVCLWSKYQHGYLKVFLLYSFGLSDRRTPSMQLLTWLTWIYTR